MFYWSTFFIFLLNFTCSKFRYDMFQRANNKGADDRFSRVEANIKFVFVVIYDLVHSASFVNS